MASYWAVQVSAWLGAVYVQGSAYLAAVLEDTSNLLSLGAVDGIILYPGLMAEHALLPEAMSMPKRLRFALNKEKRQQIVCTYGGGTGGWLH